VDNNGVLWTRLHGPDSPGSLPRHVLKCWTALVYGAPWLAWLDYDLRTGMWRFWVDPGFGHEFTRQPATWDEPSVFKWGQGMAWKAATKLVRATSWADHCAVVAAQPPPIDPRARPNHAFAVICTARGWGVEEWMAQGDVAAAAK